MAENTIKSIGVGMAIAVFLDATIIRVLLVPAMMRLMGRWNWWAGWPTGSASATSRPARRLASLRCSSGARRADVNAVVERYHLAARDYERYWAPVLEATSATLIEYIQWYAGGPPPEPVTVVDVGTGTGTLVRAALERWPTAHVVATDAAAGMLDVAREQTAGFVDRVRFVGASADRLPLEDASADVVVSSFVFQLVPDRRAALREAYRLLRPGGLLAYVTWLDRELRAPFRPMEEFDQAVLDLGIEEPEEPSGEKCAGDVPSASAAAAQLRRAGYRSVVAREDELDYHWTPEAYLEYKLAYDERALMASLSEEQRRRLEADARDRFSRLAEEDFFWHPPIVFAAARRPG